MSRLIVIVMLLIPSLSLNAQDTLPSCAPALAETARLAIVNSSFIGGYGDAAKLIKGDASTGYKDAFLAFDALQQEWWTKVVPALPECDQAQRFGVLGGRVLDEALLTLSTGSWAVTGDTTSLSESIDYHKSTWLALQTEFSTLADEIGTLAKSGDSSDAAQAAAGVVVSTSAGDSRTNPVPFGQSQHVSTVDFDASIQLTNYETDADGLVESIDNNNDRPPSGQHYVSIEFRFVCERDSSKSCKYSRVHLSLVGKKGISYRYNSAPMYGFGMDQEVFGGGEVTLSVGFLVDDDDSNFVLFTEYGDPRVYFATE